MSNRILYLWFFVMAIALPILLLSPLLLLLPQLPPQLPVLLVLVRA
jgi:hypothetical protein